MMVYGYVDQPPFELKFIANSYGMIGNGQMYLLQFGCMALAVTCVALLAFLDASLLVHFVVGTFWEISSPHSFTNLGYCNSLIFLVSKNYKFRAIFFFANIGKFFSTVCPK